jgi:hypothetical protein
MAKDFKSKDTQIEDTLDARDFARELKLWAASHSEPQVFALLQRAESKSFSASEIMIEYAVSLKEIKEKYINHLPDYYRSHLDAAVVRFADAVNLGSYTYKAS